MSPENSGPDATPEPAEAPDRAGQDAVSETPAHTETLAHTDRAYASTLTYADQARAADPGATAGTPGPAGTPDRATAPEPAATAAPAVAAAPDLVVRTEHAVFSLPASSAAAVGRDPDADVYLDDDRVSWEHAVLRPAGDGWVLEDRGSSNGTFLDGAQVTRVEITTALEIRLGDPDAGPLLRCRLQSPATAAAGRQAMAATMAAPLTGLSKVYRSPTSVMPMPAGNVRIGRAPDNDLVLDDLVVSRYHAELRKRPDDDGYEIADLGSHNGTYVNGQRITTAQPVAETDTIGIGHSTFRLAGSRLAQSVDEGEVTVSAQDLVVTVAGGKVLLDHVSFELPEKCLVGVIGPSGAGKSTLLGAMTGMRPADSGTVLYDQRDLYGHFAELRHRIGLVPQENILHTQLTARRALQYSAELRFPADTTPAERDARVTEVMTELGLAKHAETRADRLSGGQLKRMNVAQELLTRPSLLFLDEPTSGLDPGLDKSVMHQLRGLAHDGRTIIVVTHSVLNLDACDRLLVMAPGGRVAYYGPPDEALAYFGLADWADLFQAFDGQPDRDWAGEYNGSAVHSRYVAAQRGAAAPPQDGQLGLAPPAQRRRGLRQFGTLTRRYARVIAADRGFVLFSGILPLVLGMLIRLVPATQGLAGPPGNTSAQELLQILITCACLAGTASSVRELVKERPIYIRELAAGLSSGAYLMSKLAVLGAISVVQSCVIVLLGLAGRPLPAQGSFLTSMPLLELMIAVAVLAVASMCLGLLVSAFVSTSEKAMPFLVMLTMIQIILSGGVLPLAGMNGLSQLSWLAPARWGFAAVASTVNLNLIGILPGAKPDSLWTHAAGAWGRDLGITAGLAVSCLVLTWIRLRRLGPRRRR